MDSKVEQALQTVAEFYDARKVGDVGPLGFRRSSDLSTLLSCAKELKRIGLLKPDSIFLDMGCADGRVNVLMSYFVRASVGIEVDEWTLEEYAQLRKELDQVLQSRNLPLPPQNIYLFHGDACDDRTHKKIEEIVGAGLGDFDFFYTYLVMHEEFSRFVSEKAKRGAIFMCYGINRVVPQYEGLRLLNSISPLMGILALYTKE